MIRLLHVIAGLELGGVQMVLYRLLSRLNPVRFQCRVIALTEIGTVGRKIRELGVPVEALGMRPGVPDPRGLFRLARQFRRWRPDLIQTWMYHSDLMGGLAALMTGCPRPVWGVHHARLDPVETPFHTRMTARFCSWLASWMPARIVCCSEFTRQWHGAIGYAGNKLLVIRNGVDSDLFRPDETARADVRRELGLSPGTLLVGLVARWDPQKDHYTFVRAAAALLFRLPAVSFVLCGVGITWDNTKLAGWIRAAGLEDRFFLLGERADMPRLVAAFDVAALSSATEALPNAVSEAMACGVPCVVTDTGDLPYIVGETGRVAPIKDPAALAEALHHLLSLSPESRRSLGLLARQRAQDLLDLRACVAQYEALYLALARRAATDGPSAR